MYQMSEMNFDTTTKAVIVGLEELLKSTVSLQSMEHLAAVRMAIVVCESEGVQNMISRFCKAIETPSAGFLDGQWKRLSGHVRRKLYQVGVTEIIAHIIMDELWPISYEVCKWILYHGEEMGIHASSEFFWTPQVNIDYEKTAKILIKNEVLDIKKRFELACYYCLETEVRCLWGNMSLPDKRYFFVRGNLNESNLNPIVLYWTYYIQELPIEYWNCKKFIHSELVKHAVKNGNLSATKYFLGKLEKLLRNRMIANSFKIYLRTPHKWDCIVKGSQLAISFYLSSKVSHYSIIRHYNAKTLILRYFLEWPLQEHFMTVVDRLLPFWGPTFGDLMIAVFEKVLGGFEDYDYKKIFEELWCRSPMNSKLYVNTNTTIGRTMFLKFVKKHFGFVFDEFSYSLKAQLRTIVVQWDTTKNVTSFKKENVDFLKFLVQKRVATKFSIDSLAGQRLYNYQKYNPEASFYNLPLKELRHLVDGILGIK